MLFGFVMKHQVLIVVVVVFISKIRRPNQYLIIVRFKKIKHRIVKVVEVVYGFNHLLNLHLTMLFGFVMKRKVVVVVFLS